MPESPASAGAGRSASASPEGRPLRRGRWRSRRTKSPARSGGCRSRHGEALLDLLREELGLIRTREFGDGQDGKGVNACLVLAVMAARTDKARFALGVVARKPWRDGDAEAMLRGQAPDRTAFQCAARHSLCGAEGCSHRRAIVRALQQAGSAALQSQAGKRIRKGLGEIGIVGSAAAAALADAIRYAMGKRIRGRARHHGQGAPHEPGRARRRGGRGRRLGGRCRAERDHAPPGPERPRAVRPRADGAARRTRAGPAAPAHGRRAGHA